MTAAAAARPVRRRRVSEAVLAVPAINFALWRAARAEDEDDEAEGPSPWLGVAGGAGIAVSASYALLFLPILPFAFLGIIVLGVGLLPWPDWRSIPGRSAKTDVP